MEDVISVYERDYDENYPVVCMDEKPYQLIGETRNPLPMLPKKDKKIDVEYIRNGVASIFVFVEPLGGKRHVSVREHRTSRDWAEEIRWLCDEMYPNAKKIVLVMDNLNTHCRASLYKHFPASEAKRICDRLELHYTPKHGSWLDIAEIELKVMTTQCLSERIETIQLLRKKLSAWEAFRNNKKATIRWQFTTKDARTKLITLYPKILFS